MDGPFQVGDIVRSKGDDALHILRSKSHFCGRALWEVDPVPLGSYKRIAAIYEDSMEMVTLLERLAAEAAEPIEPPINPKCDPWVEFARRFG